MFLIVPTVVFKRSLIKKIGYFDEARRYCEDGHFYLRISKRYNCYLLNESLVTTGMGKAHFGEGGLSGDLFKMELGDLKNILFAYRIGIISIFELPLIAAYSLLKFFRRLLISKLRILK